MRIAVAGASGTVGRQVVAAARRRGHEVVSLSRSDGVDLTDSARLAPALDGVEVVIDAANASTIEEGPASEFFTTAASNLQQVGAEKGVSRIVTLSIVGVDGADFGYYRAKLAHEHAAAAGPVPSTIVRATQLFELPAQLMSITRTDGHASVFDVRAQPVAAQAVGQALVELAEQSPGPRGPELAGPEQANLVDMARAFVAHRGLDLEIDPDTQTMSGVPDGGLLPSPGAEIVGPTFEEWLASPDAATLPV
jgi:uncharacterized protein YbjT (DUF2867 family)